MWLQLAYFSIKKIRPSCHQTSLQIVISHSKQVYHEVTASIFGLALLADLYSKTFLPLNTHTHAHTLTTKVVSNGFPKLHIGSSVIECVHDFKYLWHIVSCTLADDDDIMHAVCNLFIRTNILIRRFSKCSLAVTRAHQEMRYLNVTWHIILYDYLFTTELWHTSTPEYFWSNTMYISNGCRFTKSTLRILLFSTFRVSSINQSPDSYEKLC